MTNLSAIWVYNPDGLFFVGNCMSNDRMSLRTFILILFCTIHCHLISGQAQKSSYNCVSPTISSIVGVDNKKIVSFEEQYQLSATESLQARKSLGLSPKTLPVVVHVIHQNGPENISDAQVQRGMLLLNEAFRNLNYYDPTTGVDTRIEFCLAQRDTAHNQINGIIRHMSPLTDTHLFDYQDLGELAYYPSDQYINIRVVRTACSNNYCAGYSVNGHSVASQDNGVVIQAKYFGTSSSDASILVHELGHYLGLSHTFHGGCENRDCLRDGDKVCDTPPDNSTGEFPCEAVFNSCYSDEDDASANNPFRSVALGGLGDQNDLTDNYMDYNAKRCRSAFTSGQAMRMHCFVENMMPQLLTSKACLLPCLNEPTASFDMVDEVVAAGTTVVFNNTSVGATTNSWCIEGQVVSEDEELSWTFDETGEYLVSLKVHNGNSLCDTIITEACLKVYCDVEAMIQYSLDNGTLLLADNSINSNTTQWVIKNAQGDTLYQSGNDMTSYLMNGANYLEVCLIAENNFCRDRATVLINPSGNEVCGNEIDDDGDGLIDLFDTDCHCDDRSYQARCPEECERLPIDFTDISMKLKWQSEILGEDVWVNAFIADINQDGTSEVVTMKIVQLGPNLYGTRIFLFEGASGQLKDTWLYNHTASGDLAIGALIPNQRNVVWPSVDSLYCTDQVGQLQWRTKLSNNRIGPISLADLDSDGSPEVICSDEIYSASGVFLAKGGNAVGCNIWGEAISSWTPTDSQCFSSSTVSADLLDAPGLEIAAGNVVYDVEINNKSGSLGNIMSVVQAESAVREGATAVGDIDGDGQMDVIVVRNNQYADGGGIWVWDPRTTKIIAQADSGISGGMAFVGDVDGDCFPEIGMTFKYELRMYKYNGTTDLELMYTLPTTDESGFTGMSMFDFNQDGKMEIVYRDEETLRIIAGATGTTITSTTLRSGTADEFPVIADVDNDGAAEIIVSGYMDNDTEYRIFCYEADGIAWAPARAVWNQNAYNVTNINDDLSIPRVPQNNAVRLDGAENCLRDKCGTPYNNFRAQATYRTQSGCMVWPGDDQDLEITASYNCHKDSMELCFFITATDITIFGRDIPVSCYPLDNIPNDSPLDVITVSSETLCFSYDLSGHDSIAIVVNDAGVYYPPFFPTTAIQECNYDNNIYILHIDNPRATIDLGPDIEKCATEVITLNAGSGFESYEWTDFSTDSIYSSALPGRHQVTATDRCGNVYTDDITVTIKTPPLVDIGNDTLVCQLESLSYSLPGSLSNVQWFPASMVSCSDCNDVIVSVDTAVCLKYVAEYDQQCYVTDSIFISIKQTEELRVSEELCHGDSLELDGRYYATTGEFILDKSSCDTSYILELIVLPSLESRDTFDICFADSIYIENGWLYEPGDYSYEHRGSTGCDSLRQVRINKLPELSHTEALSICRGDSLYFVDRWIKEEGSYEEIHLGSNGCDSSYVIEISHLLEYGLLESLEFCEGDSILLASQWFTHDTMVTINHITLAGCDSIISYEVKQLKNIETQVMSEICRGDSIFIFGDWESNSGSFSSNFQASGGCDSLVEHTLVVRDSMLIESSYEVCEGDSLFVHDEWVGAEGLYMETFQSQFQCDSISAVTLIVNKVYDTETAFEICEGDSLLIHNEWIGTAGLYEKTYQSQFQCDSISSVQLTLNEVYDTETSFEICEGDSIYVFDVWEGVSDTYRKNFTTVQGCDSLVAIHLVVNQESFHRMEDFICPGDSLLFGTLWISEQGEYIDSLKNLDNCDSIVVMQIDEIVVPVVTIGEVDCEAQTVPVQVQLEDNYTIEWSNGDTAAYSEFSLQTSSAFAIVSYRGQCITEIPFELPPYSSSAELFLPADTSIASGTSLYIDLEFDKAYWSVAWDESFLVNCDTCSVVSLVIDRETLFSFTLTDVNGCMIHHKFLVEINDIEPQIYIPNIFAPSSGKWEVFHNSKILLDELSIYDRWGNQVYQTTTDFHWDGTREGQLLEQGVYLYKLQYTDVDGDENHIYGDITLLRN